MTRITSLCAGALVLWSGGIGLAADLPDKVPELIVERLCSVNERSVRISLFDNRMAVTTVREHGTQVFFRQLLLEEEAYLTYLGAIERDAAAVVHPDDSLIGSEIGQKISLRIRLPSGEIATRDFSSSATLDLATARLSTTLDDLEQLVSHASSSAVELASWEPKIGDVVELHSGGLAEIIDLPGEGRIMLQHRDVSIVEMVPPENYAKVIKHVVERR